MLLRFDPFRELDRLTSTVSRRTTFMPMDAYRDGDTYVVTMDVPGVDPATIDLTVDKNVLTVTAERSWTPTEHQHLVASERPHGTFTRQLFLGEDLDAGQIEASCEQGVLTVRIPVAEEAKPRKVEIGTGSKAGALSAA
jgi:HSP20 family protein